MCADAVAGLHTEPGQIAEADLLKQRIAILEAESAANARLAQRLAARDSVTRILSESSTVPEAFGSILFTICQSLHWEVGCVWVADRADGRLRCTATRNLQNSGPGPFETASFEWDFSPTFSEPSIEPSDGIAVGSGTGPVPVSFLATGLPSIATLYYRIVAFNDAGITYGNTVSFTTDTLGFAVPAELAPASGGEGGGADAALARDYPTQSVVRRGAPVSSWTTRSAMRSPARPSP